MRPWHVGRQEMLERYFELLPAYQGVGLDKLQFKRVLFAGLPCYANGPLKPGFDRILQVLRFHTWDSRNTFKSTGGHILRLVALAPSSQTSANVDLLILQYEKIQIFWINIVMATHAPPSQPYANIDFLIFQLVNVKLKM